MTGHLYEYLITGLNMSEVSVLYNVLTEGRRVISMHRVKVSDTINFCNYLELVHEWFGLTNELCIVYLICILFL